jgi:hypothetical protein
LHSAGLVALRLPLFAPLENEDDISLWTGFFCNTSDIAKTALSFARWLTVALWRTRNLGILVKNNIKVARPF